MSYYSDFKYDGRGNAWFEKFQFDRWFKNNTGPILDIGCAAGDFISVNPSIIEGIDIDQNNLQRASERGFKVNNIDIEKGEMKQLESGKYRGILGSQIIEHLSNPLVFLIEIKRILKPGGKVVILTPNCPYALNHAFWDDYTHKHPFTKRSLRMIAYDAGFRDIVIYENFRPIFGMGFLIRKFNMSPRVIQKIQRVFFIRGFSLVMELKK
jgi:ubiquinone/menaquinone biosynthesis C-methylase UbiE